MGAKLTSAEAQRLIDMLKRSLISELQFPASGQTKEFEVLGDTNKDVFAINIFRSKRQPRKYNIGARIKKNGVMLLELHINPTAVHINPDGEKILSSHWHIYTEEYGRRYAFAASDIESADFVNNTITFLEKFNVIEKPNVIFQLELI